MEQVNVILNGRPVTADKGSTILQTAILHGVKIPTLCHDQRLKPTAACRICLVRVEGARNPLPACATSVAEGMSISTHTDELSQTRQMALELMLSDHYGDCIAPCKAACPAEIDIQGYVGLIANGMYSEALMLIMESNPLPSICGRVCPRFCEKECRRNLVDSPIAINALKRFAADYAVQNGIEIPVAVKPDTRRKVAIIGGGPAGLSAAYYLAKEGHAVAIFDSNPELGGMMRYGIPAYRLPRDILDKEIQRITGMCKQVRCGVTLGKDFDLDSLRKEGYSAIFMAIGAQADQKMRIPGEDLDGVVSGIEFLREVALGNRIRLGSKVAVIGGGNTAVDAAQTAVRLGAQEVTIVYRRTREDMPAAVDEIRQAEAKGVKFHFLTAPLKLLSGNGHVRTMQCQSMNLAEPDSSGRRRPEPIPGSEFTVDVDNVIMAIGQSLRAPQGSACTSVALDGHGYVYVNKETMQTKVEYIFAGGDCVSGPATVVEAIAAGKRAATSINRYLNGEQVEPPKKSYNCSKGRLDKIDAEEYASVQRIPRVEMPTLNPNVDTGFDEYELGFTENMALIESGRCLSCGCQKAFDCTLRDLATEYEVSTGKYQGYRHRHAVNDHEHPNIVRDPNKCILCGRCVRICSEVVGLGVLGFVNRGFETTVEPALGAPLSQTNCNSCGLCVSTCPTAAILPRINIDKPGPWKLSKTSTVCPGCNTGCGTELNTIGDKIVRITSSTNSRVNGQNLCDRGMFGPIAASGQRRLTKPLIAKDDKLVETSWGKALSAAAKGLLRVKNAQEDPGLALMVSPGLTNEELYLAQKVARAALGTNNINCPSMPPINESFLKLLGKDGSTCNFSDLKDSDLILMFDCELEDKYPVAAIMVREAVSRGCKLVTCGARQGPIDLMANINIKVNRRTGLDVLNAMLSYMLTYNLIDHWSVDTRMTDFRELISDLRGQPLSKLCDIPWVNPSRLVDATQLYIRARKPVILTDGDVITPAEAAGLSKLALITGNAGRGGSGILILRSKCNAQGVLDMGISPAYLPGQVHLNSPGKSIFEMEWGRFVPTRPGLDAEQVIANITAGQIAGVLIVGDGWSADNTKIDFGGSLFSVLVTTAIPAKPPYPSVMLPAASPVETQGTMTNCEGYVQRVNPVIEPRGGKRNWEILATLSASLGYRMNHETLASVTGEIARMILCYRSEYATKQMRSCYPRKLAAGLRS